MLLLLLVLLTALATGYYQRAKIFTMDRGRPSFARGYCGGQIIWSAAHTVLRRTEVVHRLLASLQDVYGHTGDLSASPGQLFSQASDLDTIDFS